MKSGDILAYLLDLRRIHLGHRNQRGFARGFCNLQKGFCVSRLSPGVGFKAFDQPFGLQQLDNAIVGLSSPRRAGMAPRFGQNLNFFRI